MDIQSSLTALLALCGTITIIGGAVGSLVALYRWLRKPSDSNSEKIEKHEKELSELKTHVENDYQDIKEIKKMQSAMCKALVHIMDHQIYGNHTEDMKQAKSDLLDLISPS